MSITCVPDSPITQVAEVSIVPVVGPEVVTGSTRLKAGTAQKMVLNMLSTAALVKLGYVSGNRMSNLQARNFKLRARAVRILMSESGMDEVNAERALNVADGDIRIALVMTKTACSAEKAKLALEKSKGIVPQAITLLLNQ